jgi:hypothetical protein
VNNDWERLCKEAVIAYLELLSQYLQEESQKIPIRIVDVQAKIGIIEYK